MVARRFGLLALVIAILLMAVLPLPDFWITQLNYIALYSLVCIGLVLLTGVAGLTSFGQAAFVGMGAYTTAWLTLHTGLSPWPEGVAFPECELVYDLVYNPPKTRFIELAEAHGVKAVNGLGMLVQQAALAFEIWTGAPAPVEIMRRAVTAC